MKNLYKLYYILNLILLNHHVLQSCPTFLGKELRRKNEPFFAQELMKAHQKGIKPMLATKAIKKTAAQQHKSTQEKKS